MADKTIGELDTGAVENGLKFPVENTNGETKKVTLNDLLGSTVGSASASDSILKKNFNTGVCDCIPLSTLITQFLTTNLIEGSNIIFTLGSSPGGTTLTISAVSGGTVWYFGDSAPASAEYGDYWLRTDTTHYGDVDQYNGSAWVNVGTFAGRDGQDGDTPTIDGTTKHWIIGQTDTGVVAEGQDGQDGTAATITVGTVTTGAAGTNASVTNSGTSSAAIFDFVIPRGADGSGGGTSVKSFTYVGTGTNNHTVTFPEIPTMVLSIYGEHTYNGDWSVSARPFVWGTRTLWVEWCAKTSSTVGNQICPPTYNDKDLTFSGSVADPGASLNALNSVYTVLYI